MEIISPEQAQEIFNQKYAHLPENHPYKAECQIFIHRLAENPDTNIYLDVKANIIRFGKDLNHVVGRIKLDNNQVTSIYTLKDGTTENTQIKQLPDGKIIRQNEISKQLSPSALKKRVPKAELGNETTGMYSVSTNEIYNEYGKLIYQNAKQSISEDASNICLLTEDLISCAAIPEEKSDNIGYYTTILNNPVTQEISLVINSNFITKSTAITNDLKAKFITTIDRSIRDHKNNKQKEEDINVITNVANKLKSLTLHYSKLARGVSTEDLK